MNSYIKDVVRLQKDYQQLVDSKSITKKDICRVCIPFRDKLGLTDLQTFRIARKEMDLAEIVELLDKKATLTPEHGICTRCCHSISEIVDGEEGIDFTISHYHELNYCPYCGSEIIK